MKSSRQSAVGADRLQTAGDSDSLGSSASKAGPPNPSPSGPKLNRQGSKTSFLSKITGGKAGSKANKNKDNN